MRIIGGEARGRTLTSPAGSNTRPTQDYVRESLFNILQRDVPGARVLDLFAGTGALSLEAVSRGAALAVLVDQDRAACACIRENIARVGAGDRCRLLHRDWRQAVAALSREGARFDIAFLDPPYRMENTGEMLAALYGGGLLAEDCLAVVEHRRGKPPALPPPFRAADLRRYGDTEITFARLLREGETT